MRPTTRRSTTYDEFLATAKTLVAKGGVQAAIWPSPGSPSSTSPGSTSTRCSSPRAAGSSWSRTASRSSTARDGLAVADFWKSLYDQKLAPNEAYQGDSFADQKAAMAIVGPWAIAVYGDKVEWGVVPVPTADGKAADGRPHVQRREVDRDVHELHEPGDRVGRS